MVYKRKHLKRTEASKCPRVGCEVVLPVKIDPGTFKRIGNMHVCRACYQDAWRLRQEKGGISMAEALTLLPPKSDRAIWPFWEERWRPLNIFPVGSMVTWDEEAPKTWHYIWTPGPMKVVAAYWCDGVPSDYLMRFVEAFGKYSKRPPRTPGWIIRVEYDPDVTDYYDPPISLLLGKAGQMFTMDVHEMWLDLVPPVE